jgi:glyoxylase-like metal-dependent hydrolase (beta-lactamase superfamily II)
VLKQVAEGVLIHESEFCRSNTVVVDGGAGVLLIDPGVLESELLCLTGDLREAGRTVVAGFSTHPHWDHLLWHPGLGSVPRHGTARCEATVRARLSAPDWKARVAGLIPADIADRVPLDLLRDIAGLPDGASRIPWDGPPVRIVEHRAHAPGHAALVVGERGVLVAGDMLSDVLIPMLDTSSADPIGDHLAALQLLEEAADDVDVLIPGHGSIAEGGLMQERIDRDRAYLHALADGRTPADPRIGPSAPFEWVAGVHERQVQALSRRVSAVDPPG